jgi:hypothetical protein
MSERKVNYVGLAALITAVSTAFGSFYALYNKGNYDEAMQRSMFIMFDYRLRQIEKHYGIDSPSVSIMMNSDESRATVPANRHFNFDAIQKMANAGEILNLPAE